MTLNSRHILILLGISLAMSSCADFSMQDGKAELYPPVFKVDTNVEEIIQTKGAPGVPPLDVPATQDIHFTVKDKEGTTVYDNQGVWSEALEMPAGSYTVEASYGSNTFGAPYYKGSCSGTIASGEEETPSITMSLCNALLATTLSEGLAVHFKADEPNPVRISTSSSSLDAGLGTYIFAPAGESLTVAISGQSSAGVAKTITHTIARLTPATASYITCDMTTTNAPVIRISAVDAWGTVAYILKATAENISDANLAHLEYYASADNWETSVKGSIVGEYVKFSGLTPETDYKVRAEIGALKSNEPSIRTSTEGLSGSASHSYTSEILDGTDFTASYTISDIIKSGITNVTLSLCKEDGTVLRRSTDLGTNSTWTSYGSVDSNWPYLPSGKYKVKGQAVQEGTTVYFSEKEIEVSSPAFTVNTPSAYTNYNTYNDSGADAANAEDGSTIFGVTHNGVKISDNILSNGKYSSLIGGYTYFIDGVKASAGNNSVKTWAAHAVTAKFTFDGTTEESPQLTCHVTGLPYRAPDAIKFNDSNHSWTKKVGNGSINADSFNLSTLSGAPQVDSPNFHIPSDIKITISNQYKKNNGSLGSYTYRVKIANSTEVIKHSSNSKGTYTLSCDETTLTPTMNYLSCHYSYEVSGNNVTVNTMIINYK